MAWTAPVTAEQLREHALGLAARHGVRVHEHPALDPDLPGRGPFAHVEARVVDTVPITDARSYLVCLHEVGHIADPGEGLVGEGRAWRFVLDASLVPVDRRLVLRWWGSHVVAAGGDVRVGGCELVADGELAGYLGTWLRVAYPGERDSPVYAPGAYDVDMTPTPNDTTTVRLPRHLVDAVRVIAAAHDRSTSAELRVALDEYAARKLPEVARVLEQRDYMPNRSVLEAVAKANQLLDDPTIRSALDAQAKANRLLGRQDAGS